MPVKSGKGVYDTSEEYLQEIVCYGGGSTIMLANGEKIKFASNRLTVVFRIDERNLIFTKFLNL